MKKLLVYLKNYIPECIMGPLFKLLEASFELIVPLVVKAIIDNGIPIGDKKYVFVRVLIMFLLAGVGFICSITAQYFAAKAATGFAKELRHSLFTHINKLSYTELDEIGTSKLITRMTSDVNTVQGCVNMVLRLFLRSPFIVFGAMIMAFTIDVKSALIFCVAIPILTIIIFAILLISIPLFKKVQGDLDKVLKITRENLTGIRVVRAFNKEQSEIKEFNENNDRLTAIQIVAGKVSSLMNPLTFIVVNLAMIILIYTGAIKVDGGTLEKGQVIALVNYMSQILVELVKLANLIIQVTKALASANRISDVFEVKSSMEFPEKSKEQTDSSYAVEFSKVSLTYKNSKEPSVSNVDIRIKKGETIGIIGGTGSGKTSLVHMIPRFYDATEGNVLINGNEIKTYSKDDIRNLVGIVMQKAVLFNGTIRENIRWGKENATDDEIFEALSRAQAKDFVMEKEGVLDYKINQGGKNLSGGQRQRLTIARALVKKPEILILDDSASALDYATDAALRKSIKELSEKQKLTTFIVSQRIASIRNADRIIVLDDGIVAGIGTHDELLETCEVYKEIHGTDGNQTENKAAGGMK